VRRGAVVVAVSDVAGGRYNPEGLDVEALIAHVRGGGTVPDGAGGDQVGNEELLELPCDVLLPAALGQVIRDDNAGRVKARVVVEGANYPVTPGGDKMLNDGGVVVIPDILANAGGVTGSYFEWTQNIQQFTWKESRFNEELCDRLTDTYRVVSRFARERSISLRQAAYAIGIQRVATASRLRGYV
jgi:glutamate dehydrogenase (NAD(P)+)